MYLHLAAEKQFKVSCLHTGKKIKVNSISVQNTIIHCLFYELYIVE